MALFTAQLVVILMGSRFIRWMQAKQGKGQPIRADGIERHIVEKAGTPTMGGVMILAGLIVGTLLWADLSNIYVWVVLFVTASYGVLGFTDDYAKVTKQSSAGLTSKQKLAAQLVVAVIAGVLTVATDNQLDLTRVLLVGYRPDELLEVGLTVVVRDDDADFRRSLPQLSFRQAGY
jgi:phospho-N-acetylmuramoyl-pentapeptide-transferase